MDFSVIKTNLIRFTIRTFVNFIRLSLFASICGIVIMMLLFSLLLLVAGGGQAPEGSWAAPAFRVIFYILTNGTGSIDYSGDLQGIGFIALDFFMPYLIGIDIVVSIIEEFTGRDLFRRLVPTLKRSLLIFLTLYFCFFTASLFGNTSNQEFPYIARFFIFGFFYFLTAIYLVFSYAIGKAVGGLLERSLIRQS